MSATVRLIPAFLVSVSLGLTQAHAAPPSYELLDDHDRWEAGQNALIDGPAGCWDLTGEASQVVTFHQPPDFFSAARSQQFPVDSVVTGRLVDGSWQGEVVRKTKPGQDLEVDLDIEIYPLFGSLPAQRDDSNEFSISLNDGQAQVGGSIGTSANLLREAIDVRSGSAETSYARWDSDENAVFFDRQIPVSKDDDRPIELAVRFPEAGKTADRIDALWPKKIKVGQWPVRVTIRDAQMHLVGHEVNGQVFPWAESVSFVAGVLGYTVGYAQQVTWKSATPCAEAAPEAGESEPSKPAPEAPESDPEAEGEPAP